ncbi:hypothetical protein [Desulfofustis limnaeus]|jgi:hypothetical protein|uniref:Uncharacterized protein n=1 Tax=Desulfofustis limnaeus TaxID=2740163 RepID=A0ABN6LZ77_9BACT|nr:hypothetical protein [Desulfofustis limnaeus]MDX9894048.1 hypothetical protein [Desulfofustis sp.]BDD85898.1 hypothetical protein DPPLL_02630 [Desulfofustis limnaeus]
MKFCIDCDNPLDFQEFLDGDRCTACRQKEQAAKQTPAAGLLPMDELLDSTLTVSGNRIELRAPEGWVLWSGEPAQVHDLGSILSGAHKIVSIRRKKSRQNRR